MDRSIGILREKLKSIALRENTVLWYCGDNGSPSSSGRVTTPFRGEKARMYEGGIRVPGLIEWPAKIPEGRISDVNSVTSDMLPTLCELAGVELPKRPLDGISLASLIDGKMTERPQPIFFWSFNANRLTSAKSKPTPYIAPDLQEGTTPLVKYLGGKLTRSFRNFHHPPIAEGDYGGPRVVLGNDFKLVFEGGKNTGVELFHLKKDRAEEHNLASEKPEVTGKMKTELRHWQDSVLKSLSGADY